MECRCKYLDPNTKRCTHPQLINIGIPSPKTCQHCKHYDGPNRGLGDTIHHIIGRATFGNADAVSRTIERVTKKPCNCGKRREKMNNMFPNLTDKKEEKPL